MIKALIQRIARFLATPWRLAKEHKYADPAAEAATRKEFQNDRFLPLVRQYIQQGETAIIFVKGYSMRPFIEHTRDRVFLEKRDTYNVGDAVLAQIAPGHYVLHRIIEKQGDSLTLQGDGNIDQVEHCREQDVSGVVTQYIRPHRIIPADDPKLIRRIRLWRKLRPIRRYLLFIYKAIV